MSASMTSAGSEERLWILGCGGFFPAHGRQTMSFLLQRPNGSALLLDAGTGTGRLIEPALREILECCEQLDIVLTHYHLDHVVGLAYLGAVWERPIRLFAPSPPLVDAEPVQTLRRLISPPLFPVSLDAFRHPIEVVAYDGAFTIDDLELKTRRQRHPGGSVGLRLGDRLAYATDTAADPETAEFVAGVDLLLHEVWCTAQEAAEDPNLLRGHSSDQEVLVLAREAEVRRLLPVHHHPHRTPRDLDQLLDQLAEAAAAQPGPIVERALDGQDLQLVG